MLPKNSFEIITEFIEQAGFGTGFAETNFPVSFPDYDLRLLVSEGINYLLGAATSGNKSIGFFHSPVDFYLQNPLKSECILITTCLPERLCTPIVFCKNITSLKDKLTKSIQVSEESRLPVILVISESVLFNYCEIDDFEFDNERIKPYIDNKSLSTFFSTENYLDNLNIAEAFLSRAFSNKFSSDNIVSINNEEGNFIDYLVPYIKSSQLESLEECSKIFISKSEEKFFKILSLHYTLNISYELLSEETNEKLVPILCPGCPFALIFSKIKTDDYTVFTDIACPSLSKHLNIKIRSLDFVAGLSRNVKNKLIFVGNISNFKNSLVKNAGGIEIILLNDTGDAQTIYPEIKPQKLQKTDITLPYSCNNIKDYGKVSIVPKKCKCLKKGEKPVCIAKTLCPALFTSHDIISVDNNLCTGCGVCKLACPYGAVK